MTKLKAPFPYFGGKSRVADIVWNALGDVPNYVEPFFGSGAVLLARPDEDEWWDRTETVNDADGMVANFWRAVQAAPKKVAKYADWPVNENDLHARHGWLVGQKDGLQARIEGSPDFYDAKIAGWWVWGLCLWIGSGFCSGTGPWQQVNGELVDTRKRVHLGNNGMGINRKRVHLGNNGMGINRQLVHLGDNGRGNALAWSEHIEAMMLALQDRLRRVRVCSGDWSRVCTPAGTWRHGLTGVFLDPPYADTATRQDNLYRIDSLSVAHQVREWAIAHGDDPRFRIVLAGYDGEHLMPEHWAVVAWKANGGYSHQRTVKDAINPHRERLWLSPHCLPLETQAAA